MRKTKIICTIGPACDNEVTIKKMIKAGMNVARMNFSHGTHEDHKKRIDMVRKVSRELGMPVAVLLDTKGPEFRTGLLQDHKIMLKKGAEFTFTTENIIGDESRVSVSYKDLAKELSEGDTILVSNGILKFTVLETDGVRIRTKVVDGGELSDRKSMSFPGKHLKQKFLSKQDIEDIKFGIENDVDFIACSFVSVRQDLIDVKKILKKYGGDNIDIIAKIENSSGYENIEEIFKECDGIMVARGDMGVEMPFEELPGLQKAMIEKCRLLGKRSITATEMLESMIHSPRPTRAETSDVANAVYDGTSAVMLSGETAAGEYPVEAVAAMAKIAEAAERNIDYADRFLEKKFVIKNSTDAISHATTAMAIDLNAKCIVACTITGATARMVSRFRGPVPVLGLTENERTFRKLALSWGVIPQMCVRCRSTDRLIKQAVDTATLALKLNRGDRIIVTAGEIKSVPGNTDLIKVIEI